MFTFKGILLSGDPTSSFRRLLLYSGSGVEQTCGLLGSTLKGWLTIWELVMSPAARGKKGLENVLLKLSSLYTPLQSTG